MSGGVGLSVSGATAVGPAGAAPSTAKIGPNAITRMGEALTELHGNAAGRALFSACGMLHHWEQPPQGMVDERDVIRLHRVARQRLGMVAYRRVARRAGELTGHYVRRHRIPRAAQLLIRGLPRPWAMRVLTRAISRHAWTFVGSGSLHYERKGSGILIIIEDSPLARGTRCDARVCDYYTASFECLFKQLVWRGLRVRELECAASGMTRCVFEVGPASRSNSGEETAPHKKP